MHEALTPTGIRLRESSAFKLRAESADAVHVLLVGVPDARVSQIRKSCDDLPDVRIVLRSRLSDPAIEEQVRMHRYDVIVVGSECDLATHRDLQERLNHSRANLAVLLLGNDLRNAFPTTGQVAESRINYICLDADTDTDLLILGILRAASLDELDHSPADVRAWHLPSASEGILVVDAAGRIVFANRPARQRTRRELNRLLHFVSSRGWPRNDLPSNGDAFRGDHSDVNATYLEWEGARYTVMRLNAPLIRPGSKPTNISGQLESSTGLPDRDMFISLCQGALETAAQRGEAAALVLISLDHLPILRSTTRGLTPVAMLHGYARRLREALRSDDCVACLGQQEFGILLYGVNNAENVTEIAETLTSKLESDLLVNDEDVRTPVSMGISLFPQDGQNIEELLRGADLALHRVRSDPQRSYEFYNPQISHALRERLQLERRLRRAVAEDKFKLHYQPILLPETGQVVGAEALLRLHDSDSVITMPGTFIPILEDNGMIRDVGRWAIDQGCRQLSECQELGMPEFMLSLNISPRQFADDGLAQYVADTLDTYGLSPSSLLLEITENVMMSDPARAGRVIGRLRDAGVNTAIDDFGTGFCSMAYLKNLPVTAIKLDRSFVRNLPQDSSDAAITLSLIDLAKHLGLWLIAEGVENESQRQFLGSHGVEMMQGFLFGRPMQHDMLLQRIQPG